MRINYLQVFEIESGEAAFGDGEGLACLIDCGVGSLICRFELVEGGNGGLEAQIEIPYHTALANGQ